MKKSDAGPFTISALNSREESIEVLQKQPANFNILNTNKIGWNRFKDQKLLNIKDARCVSTRETNNMLHPDYGLKSATIKITKTSGLQPYELLADLGDEENSGANPVIELSNTLKTLEMSILDVKTNLINSILLHGEKLGEVTIMQKIDNIRIAATNLCASGERMDISIPQVPIICPIHIKVNTVLSPKRKLVSLGPFYQPYINKADSIQDMVNSSGTNLINRYGKVNHCQVGNGVSPYYANDYIVLQGFGKSEYAADIFENTQANRLLYQAGTIKKGLNLYPTQIIEFKKIFNVENIDPTDSIELYYSVKYISNISIDNNEVDGDLYSTASSGYLLLELINVYGNGTTISDNENKIIVYADERLNLSQKSTYTKYNYPFPYFQIRTYPVIKNFGIYSPDAANHTDTDLTIIPFIEIYKISSAEPENYKMIPFNLYNWSLGGTNGEYINEMGLSETAFESDTYRQSEITDIKLLNIYIITRTPTQLKFFVEFKFHIKNNSDEPKTMIRKFVYSLKNTEAFNMGKEVSGYDNNWRFYINEIKNNKIDIYGHLDYEKDLHVGDYHSYIYPVYNKDEKTTVYIGMQEMFTKNNDQIIQYSIGHHIVYTDINIQEKAFIEYGEQIKFGSIGYSIPILYPTFTAFKNQTTGTAGNITVYTDPLNYWGYFIMFKYSLYRFNKYVNEGNYYYKPHTVHMFPTNRVIEGNVWESLPTTINELIGMDPTIDSYKIGENPMEVYGENYITIDGILCKAGKPFYYNGAASQRWVPNAGTFYKVGNYIFNTSGANTTIFNYTKDFGLVPVTHIGKSLITEPLIINQNLVFLTKTNADIYLYVFTNNQLVLLKHVDTQIDDNGTSYNYHEFKDAWGYVEQTKRLIFSIIYGVGVTTATAHFIANILVDANLNITESLTRIEIKDLKNIVKFQNMLMKRSCYMSNDTNYTLMKFITETDLTKDENIMYVKSHKFNIPAQIDKIFIGKYLMEKCLLEKQNQIHPHLQL